MTPEQREKLENTLGKVIEVAVTEADPETWDGHGKTLASLTKDERGNRYWCKKNAAASLSLVMKMHAILEHRPASDPKGAGAYVATQEETPEESLDREIRDAEKEAAQLLRRVQQDTTQRRAKVTR